MSNLNSWNSSFSNTFLSKSVHTMAVTQIRNRNSTGRASTSVNGLRARPARKLCDALSGACPT